MTEFRFLNDKKTSKNEFEEILNKGLSKSDDKNIKINKFTKAIIFNEYYNCSEHLSLSNSKGRLDTFEKAACIMIAINKNATLKNEFKNKLSINTIFSMFEGPIISGKYIETSLPSLNIKIFEENYPEDFDFIKDTLLESINNSRCSYDKSITLAASLKFMYEYINEKSSNLNIINDKNKIFTKKRTN